MIIGLETIIEGVQTLFRSTNFLDFGIVVFSFVFENYCLAMN